MLLEAEINKCCPSGYATGAISNLITWVPYFFLSAESMPFPNATTHHIPEWLSSWLTPCSAEISKSRLWPRPGGCGSGKRARMHSRSSSGSHSSSIVAANSLFSMGGATSQWSRSSSGTKPSHDYFSLMVFYMVTILFFLLLIRYKKYLF
jgi:hypothetical protein